MNWSSSAGLANVVFIPARTISALFQLKAAFGFLEQQIYWLLKLHLIQASQTKSLECSENVETLFFKHADVCSSSCGWEVCNVEEVQCAHDHSMSAELHIPQTAARSLNCCIHIADTEKRILQWRRPLWVLSVTPGSAFLLVAMRLVSKNAIFSTVCVGSIVTDELTEDFAGHLLFAGGFGLIGYWAHGVKQSQEQLLHKKQEQLVERRQA